MARRAPVVALACSLLMVQGCSTTAEPAEPESRKRPGVTLASSPTADVPDPQEVVVTRDAGKGPQSCRPEAVGELMVRFLDDVNRGADPTSSFASSFQWYSMTEGDPDRDGRHFAGFDLAAVRDYFEKRRGQNESMQLLEMSVGYDKDRDLGHIVYTIERTADDTAAFGKNVHGKGAVNCAEGKIELLSMGMARDIMDGIGPLCPQPKEAVPDAALVCT